MGKFLSIVIPRYKETEKEIFPLLSSINGQVGIDFSDIEAIIANDGERETTPLDGSFLSLFRYDTRQVTCKVNRGCGPARQAGFDVARGMYLMCCDADDTLHNVGVLGALMQEAEKNVPDMLISDWLEEVLDGDGKYRYITHENDNTWMHGKLYRRQFLVQDGIRFPDSLRVQEDSYFNGVAAAAARQRIHVPITSYVWKYSPESTTRKNGGAYAFESMPDFIHSCSLAHAEIEKRAPGLAGQKVVQFVLYCYFSLHRPEWREPGHAGHLEATEKAFTSHMEPFWHYWHETDPQTISRAYDGERARSFSGCMENETIWEWLRRIGVEA